MERASNTVSALMTLTTRETRHTARTSTLQTFRAPIVWRPSDGMHGRPIHGKDCDLSRTIRIDRQERASNTVSALVPLTTRETRHTARTNTQQTFRLSDGTYSRPIHGKDCALSQTIRVDRQERASYTVSALVPLTTRETCHTARTYTQQTFRASIVWRPSDGTHSRPIHGKDCALSRTIRVDRQERASNTVLALMPLTTREMRHTARTYT